jgi:hypothetical protein
MEVSVDFPKEQLAKANSVYLWLVHMLGGDNSLLGQGKDHKIRSVPTKDSGRLCVPSLSQGPWFLGAGSGMHPSLCTLF